MMTKEQMAEKLIRAYNHSHNARYRASNQDNLNAVIKAIEVGGEEAFYNREICKFVCDSTSSSLVGAFEDYVASKSEKIEEVPEEIPETPAPVSTPVNQVNNYMGLLEKTLAEVIVSTQGENIAKQIVGNLGDKVDEYISKTYGTIRRKVELEIDERKVEFDEKLHEKFDTVLKFVKMNEPVFLTGAAGTGKNVICKQVAKALGLDFYFTNAVTQEYKLTGFTDATGTFHETQFYKAFTKGGLFMLDEMDASIPEVLVILNAAIANRYFDFPAPIGYVEAHPDFRVIAAGNTFGLGADYDYVGRNQLDAASLDRFALVRVDYDREIELSVSEGNKELVDFCDDFRKASEKAGVRVVVSYRAIGRINKMLKVMDASEVISTCLIKNLQKDDVNMILNEMTVNNEFVNILRNFS